MSTTKNQTKGRTRRKRCEWCEELFPPDELYRGVCEECGAEHATLCICCDSWVSQDNPCRHVFWTDCGWAGAGSDDPSLDGLCRESFLLWLDRLNALTDDDGGNLVDAIEREIGRNAFWTFAWGPMLGTPAIDFIRLRPDLHAGCLSFATIEPSILRRWDDDASDDLSLGWNWLRSLGADDTPGANAQTVKWIKEWRKARAKGPQT